MLPGEVFCTQSSFQIWLSKSSGMYMINLIKTNCSLTEPSTNLGQLKMLFLGQFIPVYFYR